MVRDRQIYAYCLTIESPLGRSDNGCTVGKQSEGEDLQCERGSEKERRQTNTHSERILKKEHVILICKLSNYVCTILHSSRQRVHRLGPNVPALVTLLGSPLVTNILVTVRVYRFIILSSVGVCFRLFSA